FWHLFDAATNSGEGCFVPDEQIPIECEWNDHRPARAADNQLATWSCRVCPSRCGAVAMQYEIELDPTFFHVPIARGVIAHLWSSARSEFGAAWPNERQRGRDAVGKQKCFDVICVARGRKSGHIAFETNAPHERGDVGHGLDSKKA